MDTRKRRMTTVHLAAKSRRLIHTITISIALARNENGNVVIPIRHFVNIGEACTRSGQEDCGQNR